jgi:hypothetical protein
VSREGQDYWSDCRQIYFLDGWAWALTEKCQRICLGKEPDIKEFLDTHVIPDDLPAQHRQVLAWIKEYREENGFGEPRTNSMERTSTLRTARNRTKAVNKTAVRKRTALRKINAKNKSLLKR